MKIITNLGSSLPLELARAHGIAVPVHRIMVDGTAHDSAALGFAQLDGWVRTAREHPHVIGTSAAEYLEVFRALAPLRDLVTVVASPHVSGSHTAATSAARAIRGHKAYAGLSLRIIDSSAFELGTGLLALLLAIAARDGLDGARAELVAQAFSASSGLYLVPQALDYLLKGGHAGVLRDSVQNAPELSPLISVVDGLFQPIGAAGPKDDFTRPLLDDAAGRIGPRRPVWCGVMHADAPERAALLEHAVRARFDVKYLLVRPFHASTYLHVGRGAVGLAIGAVDGPTWSPSSVP